MVANHVDKNFLLPFGSIFFFSSAATVTIGISNAFGEVCPALPTISGRRSVVEAEAADHDQKHDASDACEDGKCRE